MNQTSNKEVICLALTFNQNFITPLYVFLTSIFENNRNNSFAMHAVATGLSEQQKAALTAYVVSNQATINFYEIDEDYVASFAIDSRYGLATFYRLLLPELLPESVKKIIYIDIDIIVLGDLAELYHIDLENKPVAAVPDPVEWDRPDLGIPNRSDYFNAGVLLISTAEWKRQQVTTKTIEFLKKNPEIATYVDQDALNVVLINNWVKLEDKFNFTYRVVPFESRKKLRAFIKHKIIIHYNESTKPWHRTSNNKLDFLYHEYFKKSPVAHLAPYQPFVVSNQNLLKFAKIKLNHLYFNMPFATGLWRKLKS